MGKFHPPHLGHLHLVDAARAGAERVTVLVGTRPGESIPGELRAEWMYRLRPDTEVIQVLDETPPSAADPGYWEIWIESIRRHAPADLDVVFSSEPYGDEIARRLGIEHVCVDPLRERHPVSGTQARVDPLRCWGLLPEPVRAFYARRVAILGPESTGKSTLARRLADHFGGAFVAEYGREHTAGIDMARFTLGDILAIAREQGAPRGPRGGAVERAAVLRYRADHHPGLERDLFRHLAGMGRSGEPPPTLRSHPAAGRRRPLGRRRDP
jgi:NadR type nicotinamide-nucleotide adenylyltransferase